MHRIGWYFALYMIAVAGTRIRVEYLEFGTGWWWLWALVNATVFVIVFELAMNSAEKRGMARGYSLKSDSQE